MYQSRVESEQQERQSKIEAEQREWEHQLCHEEMMIARVRRYSGLVWMRIMHE